MESGSLFALTPGAVQSWLIQLLPDEQTFEITTLLTTSRLAEHAVTAAASEAAVAGGDGLTCRTCNLNFDSVEEQRAHFKTDWHRFNVKHVLSGQPATSEEQFEELMEDMPSLSGSESEDSDAEESQAVTKKQSLNVGSPFIEFQIGNGNDNKKYATVWKSLLSPGKLSHHVDAEAVTGQLRALVEPKHQQWVIMMVSGGHFAAAIFQADKIVVSKTFHRYTTRRKQGGSQSANDQAKGKARSAGASIRRYNERALQQDIQDLVNEWRKQLDSCFLLFISAPSANQAIFFGGEHPLFQKDDNRIRKIPFTTRRPTLSEIKRVHFLLSCVHYSPTPTVVLPIPTDNRDTTVPSHQAASLVSKEDEDEASTSSANVQVNSPLAALTKEDRRFANLIFAACRKGKTELLKNVLTEAADKSLELLVLPDPETDLCPLQLASLEGHHELVSILLDKGADPAFTFQTGRGSKSAYDLAKDKETRNAFRRYMADHPDQWDYARAGVTSALTAEQEKEQEKKRIAREKKKKKAQRKKASKEKDGEDSSDDDDGSESSKSGTNLKPVLLQPASLAKPPGRSSGVKPVGADPTEREKRAAAAEARSRALAAPSSGVCANCAKSLSELVPFQRLTFSYCSTTCVQAHKKALGS